MWWSLNEKCDFDVKVTFQPRHWNVSGIYSYESCSYRPFQDLFSSRIWMGYNPFKWCVTNLQRVKVTLSLQVALGSTRPHVRRTTFSTNLRQVVVTTLIGILHTTHPILSLLLCSAMNTKGASRMRRVNTYTTIGCLWTFTLVSVFYFGQKLQDDQHIEFPKSTYILG